MFSVVDRVDKLFWTSFCVTSVVIDRKVTIDFNCSSLNLSELISLVYLVVMKPPSITSLTMGESAFTSLMMSLQF